MTYGELGIYVREMDGIKTSDIKIQNENKIC